MLREGPAGKTDPIFFFLPKKKQTKKKHISTDCRWVSLMPNKGHLGVLI